MTARARLMSAVLACATALAGLGALGACGPSLPANTDAYVVASVGDLPTSREGAAVTAYERVFGTTALVFAVGPVDPDSGLPPAIVAVVALGDGLTSADVDGRALGPGDQPVDREIEGAKVRSATSRQGDINLQVRLWRPAASVAVVVIGTRSPEDADAVMGAVVAQARSSGGTGG